jgi:hypothetical protein
VNLRQCSRAGLLAVLTILPGCGGSNGVTAASAPAPTPPPPPPAPVVVYQNSGPVPADSFGYVEFTVSGAGTLAATVDWTFPASVVWVAMTTEACGIQDERVFLGGCPTVGSPSLVPGAKPKTVGGAVSQAGRVRLWLANLADVDESMAIQVTHTRAAGTAAGAWTGEIAKPQWVFRRLPHRH